MESALKTSWYIVYTYPNLEKRIFTELQKKNVNAYLPMQKKIRNWSDRKKEIRTPLFPNYIFINTTEKERHKFFDINGVVNFISFGGKPAVMSDDEILNIKKFEETVFEVELSLIQGDDVMIINGPFTGVRGKLFVKKGKERFGVRLSSINQSLSLEICTSCLRKI